MTIACGARSLGCSLGGGRGGWGGESHICTSASTNPFPQQKKGLGISPASSSINLPLLFYSFFFISPCFYCTTTAFFIIIIILIFNLRWNGAVRRYYDYGRVCCTSGCTSGLWDPPSPHPIDAGAAGPARTARAGASYSDFFIHLLGCILTTQNWHTRIKFIPPGKKGSQPPFPPSFSWGKLLTFHSPRGAWGRQHSAFPRGFEKKKWESFPLDSARASLAGHSSPCPGMGLGRP